ncbi:hypothetical protein CkaCkLH20_04256 [Colletotrichum karsti]|uniref:Heterokaryon incompatibility domain-containing protein n=1 Tax=Colletotrichum karsti TaxID=1095194 RepID=A0A9P6LLW2_9PEZI|nr:uncharacterized protein CkaCkLH20_04256 [Colletotrichum karsti]KAF9878218.1 hypothetical protein CkaCkLH20_04256 [Colletotrichum karsti]
MPAYQYEPLSSPDSIRLLLLQPSDARDAELKGSLLNTTLAECDYDLIDSYTALSYVWGSSEKPCQILLDDMAFAITRSLNDALSDMRDATRLRRIWADAVCINQEDIPERNSQVLIMKDVYSTAHSTVIHLGGLTKELDAIFEAGPPVLQYDVYGHGSLASGFSKNWFTPKILGFSVLPSGCVGLISNVFSLARILIIVVWTL